jgi:predicted nucleic acid-binding protein
VKALIIDGGLHVVRLGSEDMQEVAQVAEAHTLDLDDAYQYVVARMYNLTLVSFDRDFDKTDLRRREPIDILAKPASRAS